MKKILALLLIASLLIGGASGAKKILYGDEKQLTTDVTTDTSGKGIVIAALNGLQEDVDTLENGTIDALVTEDINCTDDALISGDLSVLGLATVGETLGVTGLTTVSAVAVGVNDTTTDENPTITASDLETLYPIDASGATVTFTLPAADTVTGRLYMITADADMGENNIILATTGAGKLGGSQGGDTLTSTDADAAVQLISDGTNYQIVSMRGAWA